MVYASCVKSNRHDNDDHEVSQGLRVLGRLLARTHQMKARSTGTEMNDMASNSVQSEQLLNEESIGELASESTRGTEERGIEHNG